MAISFATSLGGIFEANLCKLSVRVSATHQITTSTKKIQREGKTNVKECEQSIHYGPLYKHYKTSKLAQLRSLPSQFKHHSHIFVHKI